MLKYKSRQNIELWLYIYIQKYIAAISTLILSTSLFYEES
jgi:hypothetical protein